MASNRDSTLQFQLNSILALDKSVLKNFSSEFIKKISEGNADKNIALRKILHFINELAEINTQLAWLLLIDLVFQKQKNKLFMSCFSTTLQVSEFSNHQATLGAIKTFANSKIHKRYVAPKLLEHENDNSVKTINILRLIAKAKKNSKNQSFKDKARETLSVFEENNNYHYLSSRLGQLKKEADRSSVKMQLDKASQQLMIGKKVSPSVINVQTYFVFLKASAKSLLSSYTKSNLLVLTGRDSEEILRDIHQLGQNIPEENIDFHLAFSGVVKTIAQAFHQTKQIYLKRRIKDLLNEFKRLVLSFDLTSELQKKSFTELALKYLEALSDFEKSAWNFPYPQDLLDKLLTECFSIMNEDQKIRLARLLIIKEQMENKSDANITSIFENLISLQPNNVIAPNADRDGNVNIRDNINQKFKANVALKTVIANQNTWVNTYNSKKFFLASKAKLFNIQEQEFNFTQAENLIVPAGIDNEISEATNSPENLINKVAPNQRGENDNGFEVVDRSVIEKNAYNAVFFKYLFRKLTVQSLLTIKISVQGILDQPENLQTLNQAINFVGINPVFLIPSATQFAKVGQLPAREMPVAAAAKEIRAAMNFAAHVAFALMQALEETLGQLREPKQGINLAEQLFEVSYCLLIEKTFEFDPSKDLKTNVNRFIICLVSQCVSASEQNINDKNNQYFNKIYDYKIYDKNNNVIDLRKAMLVILAKKEKEIERTIETRVEIKETVQQVVVQTPKKSKSRSSYLTPTKTPTKDLIGVDLSASDVKAIKSCFEVLRDQDTSSSQLMETSDLKLLDFEELSKRFETLKQKKSTSRKVEEESFEEIDFEEIQENLNHTKIKELIKNLKALNQAYYQLRSEVREVLVTISGTEFRWHSLKTIKNQLVIHAEILIEKIKEKTGKERIDVKNILLELFKQNDVALSTPLRTGVFGSHPIPQSPLFTPISTSTSAFANSPIPLNLSLSETPLPLKTTTPTFNKNSQP